MTGCAGDADPYPHGSLDLARGHGMTLGKEVCRVLETKLQPVRGPLNVAYDRVALPLQEPPARAELEKRAAAKRGIPAWVAQKMLDVLARGDKLPMQYTYPLAGLAVRQRPDVRGPFRGSGGRLRPVDRKSHRSQPPMDIGVSQRCFRLSALRPRSYRRRLRNPRSVRRRHRLFQPKGPGCRWSKKCRELAKKAGR